MLYKTEESNAPKAKRVENNLSISFKSKKGEFVIYNKETKEKIEGLKSIKIIGINDERFTIKESESTKGQFVFSSIYRSPKQTINILKYTSSDKKTTSILKGPWSEIKEAAKSKGLKYTKLVYCLVEVDGKFEKALFEVQGIGMIQLGNMGELGPVQEINVSETKDFESGGKFYHSMIKGDSSELPEGTKAFEYMNEVKECFKSEDERYEFYKDSKDESSETAEDLENANAENQIAARDSFEDEFEEDISPEDIPF